ncbi:hypothetical protein [Jatrophihabitans fulvus]
MTNNNRNPAGDPGADAPTLLGLLVLGLLTAGLIVLAVFVPSVFVFLAAVVAAAAFVTQGLRYRAAQA